LEGKVQRCSKFRRKRTL